MTIFYEKLSISKHKDTRDITDMISVNAYIE